MNLLNGNFWKKSWTFFLFSEKKQTNGFLIKNTGVQVWKVFWEVFENDTAFKPLLLVIFYVQLTKEKEKHLPENCVNNNL